MKKAMCQTVLLFFATAILATNQLDVLRLVIVAVGSIVIVAPLIPELVRTLFSDTHSDSTRVR
ncbi:MAG TPA: hypothetical protein V6C97_08245 [Oculatellaceae cyanobacterium]